jgi:outer membrane lipoprotein-sorting protein
MMKNINKLIAVLMIAAMVLAAGCGSNVSSEVKDIIEKTKEKTSDLSSASGTVQMQMSMSFSGGEALEAESAELSSSFDVEFQAVPDPEAAYMNGSMTMTMDVLDQNQTIPMEVYTVKEDSSYVTYTNSELGWTKATIEETENVSPYMDLIKDLDIKAEYKLEEEQSEDGRDLYVISTELKGDQLEQLMGLSSMLTEGMTDDTSLDLSGVKANIVYKIDKESYLPAAATINFEGFDKAFSSIMETLGVSISGGEFSMDIVYTDFNTVDEIVVPESVVSSATDLDLE